MTAKTSARRGGLKKLKLKKETLKDLVAAGFAKNQLRASVRDG